MSMSDWAKREVEIACKKERGNANPEDWDYGCACYESALKAYNSLMEDGHSGFSINITKDILNRLIEGKPLTPITDDDFNNREHYEDESFLKDANLRDNIQCPRMSSLFKEVHLDDSVSYHDNDRVICRNKCNPHLTYYNAKGRKYIDDMFPITMPYMPKSKPYIVITDECLIDSKIGDWDTEAWYEIITPEGEHIPINYFCKYILTDEIESEYDTQDREGVVHHHIRYKEKEIEITEEEFNERRRQSTK